MWFALCGWLSKRHKKNKKPLCYSLFDLIAPGQCTLEENANETRLNPPKPDTLFLLVLAQFYTIGMLLAPGQMRVKREKELFKLGLISHLLRFAKGKEIDKREE